MSLTFYLDKGASLDAGAPCLTLDGKSLSYGEVVDLSRAVAKALRRSGVQPGDKVGILSANDPVAAWGGVKLLRERFAIEPCVVTGPATDNQVGVEIITEQMNVAAFNALSNGAALGDCVIEALGLKATAVQ